jgi:hypothetical protein
VNTKAPNARRSVRSAFNRRSTSRSFGVHSISTLAPVLLAVLLGLKVMPSRPRADHSSRRRSLMRWPVRYAMSTSAASMSPLRVFLPSFP